MSVVNLQRRAWLRLGTALSAVLFAAAAVVAAVAGNAFSRSSIDIGLVVEDLDRAAKFYTVALGLREHEGFSMPGKRASEIGLTSGAPLQVRVFALGDDKDAARLKLIELSSPPTNGEPEAEPVVDSRRGYRFITVFVSDLGDTIERLKKGGVEIEYDPVQLGDNAPGGVHVLLVQDPEGNFIEIVGPRPKTE